MSKAEPIDPAYFVPEPVIFLSHSTDVIKDSHILMILRNMAGEEIPLAVKKKAIFWDVCDYVAIHMGLHSCEIHLMVENKKSAEPAYIKLNDLTFVHTQQSLLEANNNVVHLLIELIEEEQEMPPLEWNPHYQFVCRCCRRECYIWECVHMPRDPSEHPSTCRHRCCDLGMNE